MNNDTFKSIFMAFAASSALTLLPSSHAQSADQKIITYTHPAGTYLANGTQTKTPTERKINCGEFYKASTGKLYLTPEMFSQIDVEGAKIGNPIDYSQPESKVISDLSKNTVAWFSHLAEAHAQCRSRFIALSKRAGIERPPYSTDWENHTHCPAEDVYNMCKNAVMTPEK